MSAPVEAIELTKTYGTTSALDGVNLRMEAGRAYLLVGPNGAGKTTLLRCLAGLARPSAGKVSIFGRTFEDLDRPARTLGACLDPIRIPGLRSGREHLRCLAVAAGVAAARTDEMLAEVGISSQTARRRAGGYSLGTRQRLTLAAALLGDPGIVVLDEPTTGLDVHGVAWLRGQIRRWSEQGRLVLIASHSLTELAAVVDVVLALEAGRLVAEMKREELTANGQDLQGAVFDLFARHGEADR